MSLYDKIRAHRGHIVEVAVYGDENDPANAAIECISCMEVIVDEDRDPAEPVYRAPYDPDDDSTKTPERGYR